MTKFFYTLLLISLCNCTDQASSELIYTIHNNTKYKVNIKAFDTKNESTGEVYTSPLKANTITIAPNSKFEIARYTGLDSNTGFRFYSIQGIDSVRVIFNNTKEKVYSKKISENSEFSIFRGDNNRNHYITENDYKTAVNCNDDCE